MSLTINTNLTSLMVQLNLEKSTVNLNTSLERLTTGYRINSAKDDAAGMSASIDFDTKISATQVARDNVNLATSMFNTASETLELMSKHLVRARDLCVQSANGVYSKDSVNAIKQELQQLVDELYRTKNTTEFNGISLFGEKEGVTGSAGLETDISPVHNGFIAEVVEQTPDVIVTEASDLEDAIANNTVIGVANADVLAELATIVNNGNDCSGKTIVLTEDIDLSGREWTPIGKTDSSYFNGDFNGNGHVISNLKITNYAQSFCGLFGFSNGDISNVGVENVDISSNNHSVGGLVGFAGSSITNCYATGDVKGTGKNVGGLIGHNDEDITNCYATGNVTGVSCVGGLVGITNNSFDLINCYATGDVTGTGMNVGGLVGKLNANPGDIISNCYATGNVKGSDRVGGLFGFLWATDSLTNCYATGDVVGDNYVGGLFGRVQQAICTNCYASGDVTGIANVGGISGDGEAFGLSDSYFAGGVSGADVTTTGIIAGKVGSSSFFTNCKYDGSKQNGMALYNDPSGTVTTADFIDISVNNFINLQVGIDGTEGSRIKASAAFSLAGLESIINAPEKESNIRRLDKILAEVTSVQTNIGALLNRLDSVGESLDVSERTMTSANSVIKDADMAKESSAYLRSQILQQASAALLTSANQLPSMTLALIQGIR